MAMLVLCDAVRSIYIASSLLLPTHDLKSLLNELHCSKYKKKSLVVNKWH